jgi:hypothetical protein
MTMQAAPKARAPRKKMVEIDLGSATRDEIWDAAMWTARHTDLIPTMAGPTAVGKTYGLKVLAERNNAELIVILLSQHTPEEVTGFQMPDPVTGKLTEQLPYWFRRAQEVLDKGRSVYFLFDELNLAQEGVRGAMYTFFRERTVHGHKLHASDNAEVLVFAAMNQSEMEAAYESRCAFFNVPADQNYLKSFATNAWAKKAIAKGRLTDDDVAHKSNTPMPPPTTVTGSGVAALNATSHPSFWELSENSRALVLYAVVPPDVAQLLMNEAATFDVKSMIENPDVLYEYMKSLPLTEALTMASNVVLGYAQVDTGYEKAHVAMLDAIYDNPDLLEAYVAFEYTPEMQEQMKRFSPDVVIAELEARKMLVASPKANRISGSMLDRLQKYAVKV